MEEEGKNYDPVLRFEDFGRVRDQVGILLRAHDYLANVGSS